ncbi:MAG: hypothetical protein C0512_11935 [Flavobacterium sp.]|nr:hypothetical protein [Flavobacterium sp.]
MKVEKKFRIKIKISESEKDKLINILDKSLNAMSDSKLLLPLLTQDEKSITLELIEYLKK